MEAKTIKGGTLRLIDLSDQSSPEMIERNKVLFQTGYYFHFDEPENNVKTFRKIYFGNELLDLAKVNPNADFRPVYPVIKFGYDFIAEMNGVPNSQCQRATHYLLYNSLITDEWENILRNDKKTVIATLSPIEDLQSKELSWCITKIQWP